MRRFALWILVAAVAACSQFAMTAGPAMADDQARPADKTAAEKKPAAKPDIGDLERVTVEFGVE